MLESDRRVGFAGTAARLGPGLGINPRPDVFKTAFLGWAVLGSNQ